MNRNIVFALIGGLAVGFLAGYVVGGSGDRDAATPTAATPAGGVVMPAPSLGGGMAAGAPAPGQIPPGMGLPNAEMQARIIKLEAVVKAEPKNHDAWVGLGNDYFDSHQPQKAVDAYAKALALKPDDPDILTDQGVMYRQLNQFDKAIANFQKAGKINPSHVPSVFNLGIVYAGDLNKPDEAAKAFNKVLVMAPNSEQAAQARQLLAQLNKGGMPR
ncbi:MAG TPA: tetratricopeptide repeat protein [Geothrix sp.]|uniref:tetratricopeptide repeat protein n=1 Tax=Geothrix mesophila TaxID=2922723 RepID=UPI001FABBCE3|nr:tetratricopeptide repeat protein [Geothrix sp. SG198]HJV38267.1 tetratricopeptide repeat protein [Geothrix sp.]